MAFHRALDLHERGDAVGAMREYRMAFDSAHAAAAYSNLGMLLGEAGRRAECISASMSAESLSPQSAAVLYNLANALMEDGRGAEAASRYERVLRLERKHAAAYHNLALLAHRQGDSKLALARFRSALACGDDALAMIGGRTQLYATMAAAGLSESVAEEALAAQRAAAASATEDDIAVRIRLAERLLEAAAVTSGHAAKHATLAEGEEVLRRALRQAPTDDHAFNLYGTLLQSQTGRWREAVSAYRAALYARPTNGEAYHNLGTVHQRLGRLAEARAMYEAALPLASHTANVYLSLSSLSTPPENVRLLRRAIVLQPSDAEAYLRLAGALAPPPLGNAPSVNASALSSALSALAHAAHLSPAEPRVHAGLGRVRLALASVLMEQAADAFAHASSLQPMSTEAHNHVGLAHRMLGGRAAAAAAFRDALASARQVAATAQMHVGATARSKAVPRGAEPAVRVSASSAGRVESVPVPAPMPVSSSASALAEDRIDWPAVASAIASSGYAVLDSALSHHVAVALEQELRQLLPLMVGGRVGAGLHDARVRTDVLWRHTRRSESAIVNGTTAHMAALHALFDTVAAGLNQVTHVQISSNCSTAATVNQAQDCIDAHDSGDAPRAHQLARGKPQTAAASAAASYRRGSSNLGTQAPSAASLDAGEEAMRVLLTPVSWALVHAEDLQFACYRAGGYYRRHSDAEHSSRRRLTAIYYVNPEWQQSDGGVLRLHHPTGSAADIAPLLDRMVLFDSRIEHEVLAMSKTSKASKKSGAKRYQGRRQPAPRCAITQWFQDMAPPLVQSSERVLPSPLS